MKDKKLYRIMKSKRIKQSTMQLSLKTSQPDFIPEVIQVTVWVMVWELEWDMDVIPVIFLQSYILRRSYITTIMTFTMTYIIITVTGEDNVMTRHDMSYFI